MANRSYPKPETQLNSTNKSSQQNSTANGTRLSNLKFPFSENFLTRSLERNTTVNDTLKSAILSFLLTSPGERRGNAIGSFLPSLQHRLIPSTTLPNLGNELKAELSKQFPGVIFLDVILLQDLSDEVVTLNVTISFSTAITDVTQFNFSL